MCSFFLYHSLYNTDNAQSTGISNIQYPGFDRISFEWNGACGARIHVRFNCLSTDFSRIKGVKGIPLRAQMESRALPSSSASSPASLEQQQQQQPSSWEYNESSFCKIKLFRDKVISDHFIIEQAIKLTMDPIRVLSERTRMILNKLASNLKRCEVG